MKNIIEQNMDSVDIADLLKEKLIGHKIIKAENTGNGIFLVTDNGYQITVEEHEGCGGCSNGWSSISFLEDLADSISAIIDIEVKPLSNDDEYTIYIFKEDGKTSSINCDDGYGSGWYGGGFSVIIKSVKKVV